MDPRSRPDRESTRRRERPAIRPSRDGGPAALRRVHGDRLAGHAIDGATVDWTAVDWTAVDWGTVDWAAVDWTGAEWGRLLRPRASHATAAGTVGAPRMRPSERTRSLVLHSYREAEPGARWLGLHDVTSAAYRRWYLAPGRGKRPSLAVAEDRLRTHMPELVPVWKQLVDLADGDDVTARLLTMWNMPPFVSGCSSAVLPGPEPVLVRNYDYDPALFEGVVASTNWSGSRKVIGTSDLLWGLLDGMNEDGLTVSLTFGGRPGVGDGFGIPLVLRYLLETCADVGDAVAVLRRLPVAQAYNLTLADTTGACASVFVAPGERPAVSDLRVVTNHRLGVVEHPAVAGPLRSRERQTRLVDALRRGATRDDLVNEFLSPPVRTDRYAEGFGTLYTAVYEPAEGRVTYHWPEGSWERRFDDDDRTRTVTLSGT